MYFAEIYNQWRSRRGARRQPGQALPRTVYALGATSLLTDVSTEMVASVLPVYLMLALHLSPAEFGVADGLFRGGAAVAALLLGGLLTYGSGRSKLIAGAGYGMSVLAKLALLASGAFAAIVACLALDRLGKGLRAAPRDTILAASVAPHQLGLAFGTHRAMDGAGALAGPLLAAGLLWLAPQQYTLLFLVALAFALAGMAVFGRLVPADAAGTLPASAPRAQDRLALRTHWQRCLPPACRKLLAAAMLLSLFTVSEGMIYAQMQQSFALEPFMQPLLPVGTAAAFLLLAAPIGWLADRAGRLRVFVGAHIVLLPLYGLLWGAAGATPPVWQAAALVLLLGCYVAATDGVLMAAVAAAVPPAARGMSLALFAAGIAAAKLASSMLFGILWDRYDVTGAVLVYGAGLLCALALFALFNPMRLAGVPAQLLPDTP
ncbi:Major Facilitator Superfamily protein [Duganella sp. CF458]|nr:Major Facilitator Superfamily protein [Duganella sp. CF458]